VPDVDLCDVPVRAPAPAPLPTAVRSVLRRTTGREPPDDVTVHTHPAARAAADAWGARAATWGRQILIGSAGSVDDVELLVHEGAHAIQQHGGRGGSRPEVAPRGGRAEAEAVRVVDGARAGLVAPVGDGSGDGLVHLALVDDVREKLSYGVLDWVITDDEALEALALLSTIPVAQLPAQLALLGDRYLARLLDNLPDAAKTGPFYQQLVQASSAAGIVEHATDLLSRGLFDLVVTDTEVGQFFNVFTQRTPPQREQLLVDLRTAGKLDTLFANATPGHHALYIRPWMTTLTRGALSPPQKAILRTLVAEDVPIETLRLATELRFDVSLVGPTPGTTDRAWTADSLRETYLALDLLPEAHVRHSTALRELRQFDEPPTKDGLVAGTYVNDRLSVNVQAPDTAGTVTHETGHSVDVLLSFRKTRAVDPAFGGWKDYYKDVAACATDMIDESGGGIRALDAGPRADVQGAMAAAMKKPSPAERIRAAEGMEDTVAAFAWFPKLAPAARRSVRSDPALEALPVGLKTPWFSRPDDGGVHLGPHVYQDSYPERIEWVRYEHAARARRVSDYQFRGPGEWFAEAYEHYYRPDKREVLKANDPATLKYFADHVDTLAPTR
jgi:hypothetical protein